jgi:hypothetical protein
MRAKSTTQRTILVAAIKSGLGFPGFSRSRQSRNRGQFQLPPRRNRGSPEPRIGDFAGGLPVGSLATTPQPLTLGPGTSELEFPRNRPVRPPGLTRMDAGDTRTHTRVRARARART